MLEDVVKCRHLENGIFSYSPTVKTMTTIQIHHFAETYCKQTLNGILLGNEKMSCRHTRSPFYTLRRLKDVLRKG